MNPVEVLNTWSSPLIELMMKKYVKRKEREAEKMAEAQSEAKRRANFKGR